MPLRWLLGASCALSGPTTSVADTRSADPTVIVVTSTAEPIPGVDAPADDAAPPDFSVVVVDCIDQAPALAGAIEQAPVPPETIPSEPAAVTGGTASTATMPRGAEVETPAPRPTAKRRKVPWLGPLGITGIVVGAVGLGGVTVSGVFLARGRTFEADPTDESRLVVRDYDRPGWVFYGVGLAVTVVGASAVAIDVTVGRDRRARRIRLQPQLGRGQAGLAANGRF